METEENDNIAVEEDEADHLEIACNMLYDALPWVPTGQPIPHRVIHMCNQRCPTVFSDRLYICVATGNVHLCTDALCDSIVITQQAKICTLTGNMYDHDDETGIYKYDNADMNAEEPIADERIAEAEREHDLAMQLNVSSQIVVAGNVTIKRRRKNTNEHPLIEIAAAAASAPWQTDTGPPAHKKAKPNPAEEADYQRSNVYTLAITFLSQLNVDKAVIDTCLIAEACVRTWAHIQDTELFLSNVNKYQPHYHVAVMLRCIQKDGLVYGTQTFAPRIDGLSTYITCPKTFIPAPFNVPLSNFTKCSTLLRRCLAQKAQMMA